MGLDQYAFARSGEFQHQICYWRKHPNLQGWMEQLYRQKGGKEEFNSNVGVELTLEDLDSLEAAVLGKNLPITIGFFYGGNSDEEYKETDLAFIKEARDNIEDGSKIIYTSSW